MSILPHPTVSFRVVTRDSDELNQGNLPPHVAIEVGGMANRQVATLVTKQPTPNHGKYLGYEVLGDTHGHSTFTMRTADTDQARSLLRSVMESISPPEKAGELIQPTESPFSQNYHALKSQLTAICEELNRARDPLKK